MERIIVLLPWVLPPLLGAVIGYVTNALAIRMLFRPLVEKRLFGVRIPLTPGIIPRRRFQLSESIGRMVSQKLLTEEVLESKIDSSEFRANLRQSIGKLTDDLLDGSVTVASSGAPESSFTAVVDQLLVSFFSSDTFRTTAVGLAERLTRGVLALKADTLLPDGDEIRGLVGRLLKLVSSDKSRDAVSRAVHSWVEGHLRRNTELKQLLGRPLIAAIVVSVPRLYDPIVQTLLEYLNKPSTRSELESGGRELLKAILKRLNLVQRILVSATQYQKNLNENMPGIVDDVLTTLEQAASSSRNRRRLIGQARRTVVRWAGMGAADVARLVGFEPSESVPRLIQEAQRLISRTEVRARIEELALQATDDWRSREVGELVERISGLGDDELARRAAQIVERWTSDRAKLDELSRGLRTFVRTIDGEGSKRPLRRLLPMTADQQGVLNDWLTDVTAVQIKRRVPELLRGIDVHSMVVAKIDSLDVRDVEDLLLMVIARHLKWINLFGAVLGALIGGLQIALNLLT